jgi:O-antigen/teichoic acid export membrane protein
MGAEAPRSQANGWRNRVGARGRSVLNAGAWGLVAKLCAAANLLLAVPFVLHALGPVRFGAWATLVSLVTFAGFLDFGFGNGTMNLVAAAHGKGEHSVVAEILHEGWRVLLGIAVAIAIVAAVLLPLLHWNRLLGLPGTQAPESRLAIAAVLFSIALAVPLNLATRAQLGLGRGERAFRWQAAGQVLATVTVILLAISRASLPVLTAAAVATPLLGAAGNSLMLWREYARARGDGRQRSSRHREIAGRIRREGVLFFVLQLAAALAFSADLPLVSTLRGAAEAGTYAIVQRLFSVIPLCLSLVWAPLWPIYRQALARGDHAWVMRTLRRSTVVALAFAAVAGLVFASAFPLIAGLWIHHPLPVDRILLAGFVLWCIVEAGATALSTMLNAASVMRFQVVTSVIFATICFAGKAVVLAQIGIDGVPWVTVVTWCTVSAVAFALAGRRVFAGIASARY